MLTNLPAISSKLLPRNRIASGEAKPKILSFPGVSQNKKDCPIDVIFKGGGTTIDDIDFGSGGKTDCLLRYAVGRI
ncbi:unnamed protein product [Didymodactylos carnosus]|uniref:Uncharacterized protein n=1 Tax=Didymodactylos carnosus TaxID=1234261 RepID=A0A814PE77_9BILA|nr:unnamed protein product [Didymodactylos carnosus]CAF3869588.1 unnamed protein product [Didymodactylos carnosus]